MNGHDTANTDTTKDSTMSNSNDTITSNHDGHDGNRTAEPQPKLTNAEFLDLPPEPLRRYPVTRSEVEAGCTDGRRWLP